MRLAARGMTITVGHTRELVRKLEFEVEAGTLWAVVGPNGSGKSTLVRTLCGLHEAARGHVEIDGKPLAQLSAGRRAQALAYLPQHTTLYHDLVVREVVMLGRLPYLRRFAAPSSADTNQVQAALEAVEAQHLIARRVSTLSGGERQRVMLARMLATEAPLLVLDEPATALDIGHALRLMQLLQRLAQQGRAVVVAMHDLDLADRFSTHAICLHGDAAATSTVGTRARVFDPDALGSVFGVSLERSPKGRLTVELPPQGLV